MQYIHRPALDWFSAYLHSRQQHVTVLGATSSKCPVTSGVPQGSLLGPVSFLLYVNDLPDVVQSSKVASFADDTQIYCRVDSASDADSLQQDLRSLERWSLASGLVFNKDMCKGQRITRKRTPVKFPYTIKGIISTSENKLLRK